MERLLDTEHENEPIVLSLLSSVETDGPRSQRRIAAERGIALGLVNTDVAGAQASYEQAAEACGRDRVLVPALLGLRRPKSAEGAA